MLIPLKQGLKPIQPSMSLEQGDVEMLIPLKQGLKHDILLSINGNNIVEMLIPLKQGLKLFMEDLNLEK